QRDIFSHFISLPSSPREVDTKFMLYSRKNRQVPVLLDYLRYESLGVDQFQRQKSLVFIVHGFGENGNATWILEMKDAFLEMEDVNVVAVDWNKGCPMPMYMTAAANTALVGRQIARLVEVLAHRHPDTVVPDKVHLVGFSLGAQVAGFAGRSFSRTIGKKIGRITGLDAAGPLFESYGFHVSRHDAQFVDGIHTSAGTNLLKGCLGMVKPYGNANFYPNGGKSQPGCW
ncbi:Ves G 1 allergen precursor, putative, partial [Ixodes scapularis]